MPQPTRPISSAGFNPGLGEATLFLRSTDGIEPGESLLSIPSFIADGNGTSLLESRSRVSGQTLSQVLHNSEDAISCKGQDSSVGTLAQASGHNCHQRTGKRGCGKEQVKSSSFKVTLAVLIIAQQSSRTPLRSTADVTNTPESTLSRMDAGSPRQKTWVDLEAARSQTDTHRLSALLES